MGSNPSNNSVVRDGVPANRHDPSGKMTDQGRETPREPPVSARMGIAIYIQERASATGQLTNLNIRGKEAIENPGIRRQERTNHLHDRDFFSNSHLVYCQLLRGDFRRNPRGCVNVFLKRRHCNSRGSHSVFRAGVEVHCQVTQE
jgi:hypothetical protein